MPVMLHLREASDSGPFPSLLLDFLAGHEIVTGVPLCGGSEVRVEPGTRVVVETSHPDGLRIRECTILHRSPIPTPCLHLSWPECVERIQRRAFVRVSVQLQAMIRLGSRGGMDPRLLPGTATDLSAGGARIELSEALPVGTPLHLRVELPATGEMRLSAVVVTGGSSNAPRGKQGSPWAAVRFLDLTEPMRRELTRFVFAVERQQIRNNIGANRQGRTGPRIQ